jgi:hypothetical protein
MLHIPLTSSWNYYFLHVYSSLFFVTPFSCLEIMQLIFYSIKYIFTSVVYKSFCKFLHWWVSTYKYLPSILKAKSVVSRYTIFLGNIFFVTAESKKASHPTRFFPPFLFSHSLSSMALAYLLQMMNAATRRLQWPESVNILEAKKVPSIYCWSERILLDTGSSVRQ